jgi:small conductance mechanosensitive channel
MEKTVEETLGKELEQLTSIYKIVTEFLVNYSFQLLGALLILIIGFFIAGKLGRMVLRTCERHNMDITLSRFLANLTKIIFIVLIAVIALGKIGISVAPFLAAVGAISLGAGLAVQGLLSNYSAGLNLIITRPFVVGDTITIQGVSGIVKEIKLACTILSDEDDVEITIPNRHILGEILHNSHQDTLIETQIGISYASNPQQAIAVISTALDALAYLSAERSPLVGIDSFGDSSINIGIRFWAPTFKHYEARYQANQLIHQALLDSGIDIPFPQQEVRLLAD